MMAGIAMLRALNHGKPAPPRGAAAGARLHVGAGEVPGRCLNASPSLATMTARPSSPAWRGSHGS
jgi:hypothetical protein